MSDPKICGIDEAGRGPVMGPMVIASVLCTPKQIDELKRLGVKDSKLHKQSERDGLFDKIRKIVSDYDIIVIEPKEIDDALESSLMNLNLLEQEKYVQMINNHCPDEAYMDCPSINAPKFTMQVRAACDPKLKGMKLVCEHKADLNYVVVSAASILAKVTRDREIERLKNEVGIDFGSGYPSDPKTQEFLRSSCLDYDIFRKSWQSYKKVIAAKAQTSLSEF